MKRKAYPEYKPTGIEWLGDVPEHWQVNRVKNIASTISKGTTPSTEGFDILSEGAIRFLKAENIVDNNLSYFPEFFIDEKTNRALNRSILNEKDILIIIAGATIGKVAILKKEFLPANTNQAVCFIRLKINKMVLFCWYYLRSIYIRNFITVNSVQSAQPNIAMGTLKDIIIPLPPLSEQEAIAAYLDRETGRIDLLVEKKKRLVELLREKRSALISRAVTKGLDMSVNMKPSGIEWLGDIPEHWEVKSLRHLFDNYDSKRIPLSSEERGGLEKIYPYYGASGIIDFVDDYIYDEALILVAEDGANLLSRSTPLAFRASGKFWVNNHAHVLKPKFNVIKYWENLLQIFDYTPFVSGSAQPKLTAENLGSIKLPHPPLSEQQAIANYLDKETTKIDALIQKVEIAINKLNEYRSALISAAVTGKIDVRESL